MLKNVSRFPHFLRNRVGDGLVIQGLPPSYSAQPHIWQEAEISCFISWCSPGWNRLLVKLPCPCYLKPLGVLSLSLCLPESLHLARTYELPLILLSEVHLFLRPSFMAPPPWRTLPLWEIPHLCEFRKPWLLVY